MQHLKATEKSAAREELLIRCRNVKSVLLQILFYIEEGQTGGSVVITASRS